MYKVGKIIPIIGPPGFGKSTLAICVGHLVISKGIVVRYIDMGELHVTHQLIQQVMAEKILYQESTHSDMTNVTFDHLLSWSGRRYWQNLIIFDNCDELLNNQRDQFNEAIEKFVRQSNKIKVIVTSREESLFVETSRAIKVDSLSIDEACDLLEQKSPGLLNVNEKTAIANLTGSVPLALQIIGSLLNKRLLPPTPCAIIEKLKQQPIQILSPSDLTRNMRINASISVSYNYLKTKLKKLARYLANFPGSFSKSMASAVLRSFSSNIFQVTEEYVTSSLQLLVTRSLLEYTPVSGRYHFHHLLREFFLDVQIKNHREERGRFVLAFQSQVSIFLRKLTDFFAESPKEAVSVLDSEKHNVQHLLKITARPYNCSHEAYSTAVAAINIAVTFKFLPCRFSTKELYEPVSSIVSVMRRKVVTSKIDQEIVFDSMWYVDFTSHHATLLSELKGMEAAANWFMKNAIIIEESSKKVTDPKLQRKMTTVYNKFYIHLLMYEKYIDEERVRVYNTRILQKTLQLQPDTEGVDMTCKYTSDMECPYKNIATAFYHIKEYKRSIQFLEKALLFEGLGLSDYVALSTYLVNSYENINDHEKAKDAFERTIMHIYVDVLQTPSTLVILHYRSYVRILRDYGETQKALELERKELNELVETGARGGVIEGLRAYDLSRQLFDQGNDTEAIAMAKLVLRIIDHEQGIGTESFWLAMKMIIGKAQCRSGNSSDGEIILKEVVDWIIDQNKTMVYEQEYSDGCSYLVFHSKYFRECYLKKIDNVGGFIFAAGVACVYYLVVPPLDLYVSEEHKKGTVNHFEQLMSESGIKDIMLHSKYEFEGDFALSTTFDYPYSEEKEDVAHESESPIIVRFITFAFNFALRFVIVRAIVNVFLITMKLCIFTAIVLCVYRCLHCCGCGCCFCCCHLFSRCTKTLVQSFSILYTYIAIKYFND